MLTGTLLTVVPGDGADDGVLLPRDAVARALCISLRASGVVLALALGMLHATAVFSTTETEESADLGDGSEESEEG